MKKNTFVKPTILELIWLRICLLYPPFRNKFQKELEVVENELKKIIEEYIPQIKDEIISKGTHFYEWVYQDFKRGSKYYSNLIRLETEDGKMINHLSEEMMEKINSIKNYNYYIHPIHNPVSLIRTSLPGMIHTKNAINYCEYLIKSINSKD